MRLRNLDVKDIPYQLDWMQDEEVNSFFQIDFKLKTYEDVLEFVQTGTNQHNIHKAIVNDEDIYLGTISLKNINYKEKKAEYAIVIRKEFWGLGVASFATSEIINISKQLGLKKIYLTVLENNLNAIKLYEKFGFKRNSSYDNIVNVKSRFEKNIYFEKDLDNYEQ